MARLIGAVVLVALTSCLGDVVSADRGVGAPGGTGRTTAAACPKATANALTFKGPTGCVRISALVGRDCPEESPPMLVRGLGTSHERRFLGGTYAVTLPGLPIGSRLVGETEGMTVFEIPTERSSLYVQRGASVERWLPLPSRVSSSTPTAFFIGDSITYGAEPYLAAALPGWQVGFDAVIGRSSEGGVAPAATEATTPPDVAVIELGTNDFYPETFRIDASQILDSLQKVPFVVWQTVHSPLGQVPEINKTIRELVAAHPNTAIADWNHFVPPDSIGPDGIHPAAGHDDEMAKLQAPVLQGWYGAVTDPNPLTCPPPQGSSTHSVSVPSSP